MKPVVILSPIFGVFALLLSSCADPYYGGASYGSSYPASSAVVSAGYSSGYYPSYGGGYYSSYNRGYYPRYQAPVVVNRYYDSGRYHNSSRGKYDRHDRYAHNRNHSYAHNRNHSKDYRSHGGSSSRYRDQHKVVSRDHRSHDSRSHRSDQRSGTSTGRYVSPERSRALIEQRKHERSIENFKRQIQEQRRNAPSHLQRTYSPRPQQQHSTPPTQQRSREQVERNRQTVSTADSGGRGRSSGERSGRGGDRRIR